MEWIVTGVLIPIIVGVYTVIRNYSQDKADKEERINDLENRVLVLERKVEGIEDDITEIKELREDIRQMKTDLAIVVTLLNERTKKGA